MRTASAVELELWIVAFACLCAALALGVEVARRTPARIDVEAVALRGHAVPAALFFTALGRWPALLALGTAAFLTALRIGTGLGAVAVLCATQTISQGVTMLLKIAFRRTRPDGWLRILEKDLSYPSGHAVTAIVFFTGFAILAWHAPFPRPLATVLVVILLACGLGIPWSRLALGAHYLTDVAGGLVLGTAMLCAALALILHFTLTPIPG